MFNEKDKVGPKTKMKTKFYFFIEQPKITDI